MNRHVYMTHRWRLASGDLLHQCLRPPQLSILQGGGGGGDGTTRWTHSPPNTPTPRQHHSPSLTQTHTHMHSFTHHFLSLLQTINQPPDSLTCLIHSHIITSFYHHQYLRQPDTFNTQSNSFTHSSHSLADHQPHTHTHHHQRGPVCVSIHPPPPLSPTSVCIQTVS